MEVESPKQSSAAGVLREGFKLPGKNGRIVSLVTLLTLFPLSLLVLYHTIIVLPYAQRVASKAALLPIDDPTSSEAAAERAELLRAVRSFVIVELVYASATSIVSLVALMATVYSAAAIHGGKGLTLGALSWRVATTWKRPLITWLYAVLIAVAFTFTYLLWVGVVVMILGAGIPTAAVVLVLSILAFGFVVYWAAAWMLAMVASVVEENCYGMEALGKAEVLIKGRKVQGFVLVLTTTLCAFIIIWLSNLATSAKLELRIGVQIVFVCLFCFVKLWTLIVFTIFYFECKRSHGEKMEMEGLADEEPKYTALSAKV